MVAEIDELKQFMDAIKSPYTIVDFYAQWCGPCKAIEPKLNLLSQQYPNVVFVKVDVDKPSLDSVVNACKVASLPTFCFFIKGECVDVLVGGDITQLEARLLKMLS